MKVGVRGSTWSALAAASVLWMAQSAAAAQAPSGSTGQCKDGSYTQAASKSGACRGHKGIQSWFADAGAAAKPSAPRASQPAPAAAPAPAAQAAPSAPAAPSAGPAPAKTGRMSPAARAATVPQAPGGGGGKVWVNTESKVYHCEGDAFYGKTKKGQYMTEADAKAAGAHADRNKPCTK